jgi:hypothetical protein
VGRATPPLYLTRVPLVFGGQEQEGSILHNDVHIMSTSGLTSWIPHKATGVSPAPRTLHTATLVGEKVYVFGGIVNDDAEGALDPHVYVYNTVSRSWSRPRAVGLDPVARYGQTVVHWNDEGTDKLVVYGGASEDTVLNDVAVYNIRECLRMVV